MQQKGARGMSSTRLQGIIDAAEGDTENALLFCGSNAYRAEGISTVAAVMDALVNGEK